MNEIKSFGYTDLLEKLVIENRWRFVVFTIYLFGVTKEFIYYKLYDINILEYSTLYDFFVSPFSDFLLLLYAIIFTLLLLRGKSNKKIENSYKSGNKTSDSKTMSCIEENLKLGCATFLTFITMISFIVISIMFINLNWITILTMVIIGVFLYILESFISSKYFVGSFVSYILIFSIYCIVNPLFQMLFVNTGRISSNNSKISFKYESSIFTENENLILLGTNSNYMFIRNRLDKETKIYSKNKVKQLSYKKFIQ